jgi:hypothetical protein
MQEDEINEKCSEFRNSLMKNLDRITKDVKDIKNFQQHELKVCIFNRKVAKDIKNDTFRNAFNIRDDYEHGEVDLKLTAGF